VFADVGHPGLGNAQHVKHIDHHRAPMLATGADDPLVAQEPHVDDLWKRRDPERRHRADLEGQKVLLQLALGGEPQVVAGAEQLARAAQVETLARRDDGEPVALAVVQRDRLGRRLRVGVGRPRPVTAEYVASCSTTS
jgi:hypothetical protein